MNKQQALALLSQHRDEIAKKFSVKHLALFGSTARGEATDGSDVDLAVRFDPERRPLGLAYIGRLDELSETLSDLLGCPVDIVVEPVKAARLQRSIDEDRAIAF